MNDVKYVCAKAVGKTQQGKINGLGSIIEIDEVYFQKEKITFKRFSPNCGYLLEFVERQNMKYFLVKK